MSLLPNKTDEPKPEAETPPEPKGYVVAPNRYVRIGEKTLGAGEPIPDDADEKLVKNLLRSNQIVKA